MQVHPEFVTQAVLPALCNPAHSSGTAELLAAARHFLEALARSLEPMKCGWSLSIWLLPREGLASRVALPRVSIRNLCRGVLEVVWEPKLKAQGPLGRQTRSMDDAVEHVV